VAINSKDEEPVKQQNAHLQQQVIQLQEQVSELQIKIQKAKEVKNGFVLLYLWAAFNGRC